MHKKTKVKSIEKIWKTKTIENRILLNELEANIE